MPKRRRKLDPERKPRFCDPGACSFCEYIGEGDFFCNWQDNIVVSDWEPTDMYMKCKKAKEYDRFRPSMKDNTGGNKDE